VFQHLPSRNPGLQFAEPSLNGGHIMTREPDLSPDEVAKIRGVSGRTVRRWIAEGRLPAYRVGPRLIRIKAEDLEKAMRRIPTAGDAT
jgi:excisionase family DNA binding protein